MLFLIFILLAICVTAPFFGVTTADFRSEDARPAQGWFPASNLRR
jgi:hypothetical protein